MTRQSTHNTLAPSEAICGGLVYLSSIEEAYANNTLLPYMRIIERAWDDFGLTGVLCVDGIPTIYFKEVGKPLPTEKLNDLHRRFWNQGVAQTLVVGDPRTVRIFSGLAKPQKNDAPLSDKATLVKELGRLEFAKQINSFCQANANGVWYAEHAGQYQSGSSVDAYLLDNLVTLRDLLTQGKDGKHRLPPRTAHALIGRVLFVCYLADRGIYRFPDKINADTLNKALKDRSDSVAIDFLYELFGQLKDEFNGSMFDQDLAVEKKQVQPFHIRILRDFLDGQKPMSPQHNLGFWAYDFKLIPVETISAIYEEFLAHEDPERKRETGAFYTPRFLAEMTIDVAVEGRADWHTLRYLDPCCGSGIFLVTLFNRLATRWLLDNPTAENDPEDYLRKARGLIAILTNNLRGVDENPTACRLACFSLYIALLDCLSPSDIRTFVLQTRNKLPRLLADYVTEPGPGYIPVVREADFLKENGLAEESFDCIIGNPPWQGRGSKQLALHILEQAERYIVDNGEGCLLLPSKIFLNSKTNKFQAQWLGRVTVERVVQLADYSFILFEQAKCPSMIVRYYKKKPEDASHRIAYDTPKFNLTSRRRGLVTIESPDHKWLSQAQLREAAQNNEAPVIWKRWLWGTGRDQRLLNYLDTMPRLGGRIDILSELRKRKAERTKPWAIGQGLKPFKDEDGESDRPLIPMPWSLETPFITPANLAGTTFAYSVDTASLGKHLKAKKNRLDVLYSSPPTELFSPPFVLINQGYSNVAFCDFQATFQHSLQSIAGPLTDEDLLLFLTAYLRSSLANYTLFHTAVNWGTERDKVHLEELLRLPFPLPEDAPAVNAHEIVSKIAARMKVEREAQENLLQECRMHYRNLTGCDETQAVKEWHKLRKVRTEALQTELEPLIYDYFGLLAPEKMLVDDTVTVFIPSSTPPNAESLDLPTLQPATKSKVPGYDSGLAVYAETLANTLNIWAAERDSNFRVSPTIGTDSLSGMAMVSLTVGSDVASIVVCDLKGELAHWLKRGFDAFARETRTLRAERELFWFEGKHFYIIRPLTLIHWTRTAALNDADTIYGEIAQARRAANA
jgi:Eco57I restriction-modification methylase